MSANQQADAGGPGTCLACRGTGHLLSSLGGEPHQVTCPWCRGTGSRIPGIDAQESPAETAAPTGKEAGPGTESARK
jgi:DnaJ-class molecular chaperone